MMNWPEYRTELMGRIGEIGKLSPDTLAGYQALSKAGSKTNHLDAKTRELIALAVSVTSRCDGCITVHTSEALKQGASREEIAEALGVAVALNAGAALVYSARVMGAVSQYGSAA
jgi:AhpD family alkylhydroperoxidase